MPPSPFNELLFLGFLILDMTMVVVVYRVFGREGLFGYVVLAIIACNIEVLKLVQMFGMTVTLGNILYGSLFLTSDILVELYGKREAQRAVWLGFSGLVLITVFMQLALLFRPAPIDSAQPHLAAIFGFLPRIAVASLTAYVLSQLTDVAIFWAIKQWMRDKALWVRNNVSTLFSQGLDTVTFTVLAFAPMPLIGRVPGFENWQTIWQVAWTTYVIKFIVSVLDTPFVYWARLVGWRVYGLQPTRATGSRVF